MTMESFHSGGRIITDADRQLVAEMLCRPESQWRAEFARVPYTRHFEPFERYYELAEAIRELPGGLSLPHRKTVQNCLYKWAWRMNDIAVDYRERLRFRQPNKWPAYAGEIARARTRGRVPTPVDGYHVAIAVRWNYRQAAKGACIVVEEKPDFDTFDYRFLAGLDVLALVCGAEIQFADLLVRRLAADGVRSVSARRLDRPGRPIEKLWPGGIQWAL